MSRTRSIQARLLVTVLVFAVLVWRLGAGPFLDGVRTLEGRALAAAAGLAVMTTLCCAWRWKIVAGRVGQGAWSFAVTLALAVPLTVVFARAFASVFETPFRQHRGWSWAARRRHPQASEAPA